MAVIFGQCEKAVCRLGKIPFLEHLCDGIKMADDCELQCEMPLMISAKYLPEWSVWEGVRELVQNWHDGVLKAFERDHSYKGSRLLFEKVREGEAPY